MKTILILWALGCSAVAFAQIEAAVPTVTARLVSMPSPQGKIVQVSIPDCEQLPVENLLAAGTTCMTQDNQLARYQDQAHFVPLSDSERALYLSHYVETFSSQDLDL